MRQWLLVLAVAGCGGSARAPDPDGAGTPNLTVNVRAMFGMVVSSPPGIRCGACQATQTSGAPCPLGPKIDRACTADFAAGTQVTLSLVGQDMYTDYVCAEEPANTVRSCEIEIGPPLTIGVWGEVK